MLCQVGYANINLFIYLINKPMNHDPLQAYMVQYNNNNNATYITTGKIHENSILNS